MSCPLIGNSLATMGAISGKVPLELTQVLVLELAFVCNNPSLVRDVLRFG